MSVVYLKRWREGRTDRFHVPSAVAEGGLPSRSLPGATALAREYLSEVFADRYRRRAADNGLVTVHGEHADEATLRAEIVDHLGELPADPDATRPYRDAREVVAEPDDVDSWRGRQRERWISDLTRSTRANLPRYRPAAAPRAPRGEPLSETDRRRAARRRIRYDELEAIRRAAHAYYDGMPHHDADRRAAHRAAVPFRTKIGDLVTWIGALIGLWEDRWQDEGDDWPDAARRIGAPRRPIAFPGPRVTGLEIRRTHRRIRRLRGFDYALRDDYFLEEMRALVNTYDVIDDLEQIANAETNLDRAAALREHVEELRELMLGDSISMITTAAEERLDHVAAA